MTSQPGLNSAAKSQVEVERRHSMRHDLKQFTEHQLQPGVSRSPRSDGSERLRGCKGRRAGIRWTVSIACTEMVQYLYWIFINWYSWARACSKNASVYPQVFPFDVSLVFKIKINLVAKNILCKKYLAICENSWVSLICVVGAQPPPNRASCVTTFPY